MVRATDLNTRLVLAGLLREADSPCRRLFLDYHGLKILGGWMAELGWAAARELELKEKVEDVLASMSIPHRTMLIESKVWEKVAAWAEGAPQPPPNIQDKGVNDDTASGRQDSDSFRGGEEEMKMKTELEDKEGIPFKSDGDNITDVVRETVSRIVDVICSQASAVVQTVESA